MIQFTKVMNNPSDPPKMIDSSRDHLTKSPSWRTIQAILQSWLTQIEIIEPSHQGDKRPPKDDRVK